MGSNGSESAAPKLAALDVHYGKSGACAAAVLFHGWADAEPADSLTLRLDGSAPAYEPGAFYKRELPALLALLARIQQQLDVVVIDGFVTLGAERRPGLGWRLWEALEGRSAVIGVAKTPYRGLPRGAALNRGASDRPLFVTAIGLEEAEARAFIAAMRGPHRLPALLKRVDALSRGR